MAPACQLLLVITLLSFHDCCFAWLLSEAFQMGPKRCVDWASCSVLGLDCYACSKSRGFAGAARLSIELWLQMLLVLHGQCSHTPALGLLELIRSRVLMPAGPLHSADATHQGQQRQPRLNRQPHRYVLLRRWPQFLKEAFRKYMTGHHLLYGSSWQAHGAKPRGCVGAIKSRYVF